LIDGRLKGAIVFPLVEGYPENKIEIISSQNIKKTLSKETGDTLEVETLQ
jgi:CTP-dependent riboflavin kinase